MNDSSKSSRDRVRENLLAIAERERQARRADRTGGGENVRHYAIDGRAQPVILAADALRAVQDWRQDHGSQPVLAELRRCTDELLRFREQLPDPAKRCFDSLDDLVRELDLRAPEEPQAMGSAREKLVERITSLGEVLVATLLAPEPASPSVPLRRPYRRRAPG